MKRFFKSYGFSIFWIIAFIDIGATAFNNSILHIITKPLLLPLLVISLFFSVSPGNKKALVLTGLFFAFMGDVALLFEDRNPLFFITGLVCFLLTHLFYILFFLTIKSAAPSLLKKKPALIILVVAYTGGLLFLLVPKLGSLVVPVILYAVILSLMFLCSLHVYHKVNSQAGKLFIWGAALFVVSDSLLAINKFYSPLAYAGFFIMLTYCLAQYLIVKGFIKMDAYVTVSI